MAKRPRRDSKVLIGAIAAFLSGAGCWCFDIRVPSPPVLPGALLVVGNDAWIFGDGPSVHSKGEGRDAKRDVRRAYRKDRPRFNRRNLRSELALW